MFDLFCDRGYFSLDLILRKRQITKAQLLALQVGRLKDQGKAAFQHISIQSSWLAALHLNGICRA